jgi:hypothetical protein
MRFSRSSILNPILLLSVVFSWRCVTFSRSDDGVEGVAVPRVDEGDNHSQESPAAEELVVQDYLETLTNEELEKICVDRGFSIAARDDRGSGSDNQSPLSREDYLSAARRCLTLEDEMNAIIAAHPELAAELDAEIERMRRHKIQLERERDEILAQKALLEEQLENAGVDVSRCMNRTATTSLESRDLASLNPEEMTLDEVLRHSLTLLYQRVMQDVMMAKRFLDPVVLKPMGRGLRIAWKYSKPTLTALWIKARTTAHAYLVRSSGENATSTIATSTAAVA